MERLLVWMITFTIELTVKIMGFIANIILQITFKFIGFCFSSLGWGMHEGFKFAGAKANSKDLLILGPGEALQPRTSYRELFDYSQTANSDEIMQFTHGNPNNGDFWLGNYVELKRNQPQLTNHVWLPNDFLHQHLLIVGAPGSGKTELLLRSLPNLMYKGNVVCVDAAGFLGDRLSTPAGRVGSKLVRWDLSATGTSVVWNFLEELERVPEERDIRAIAEAIYGNFDDTGNNAAFWKRDIMWLTAIIAIAVAARKQNIFQFNPSNLPDLITDRNLVQDLLNQLPQAKQRWASDLHAYFTIPDDRFGLDISFLQNKLSPFKDPSVRKICDGSTSIFLLSALNGPSRHAFVIGQSLADGKFGSALAGVMISYITNILYRRMKRPNHSWTPTYLICDEAPRLKNIDYEELTAIGRNAKAGVFLICQSIDQFPEKTLPALNNCRTQLFLQGVSHKTAEWLSKPLGEYQRRVMTMSVDRGIFGPSPLNRRSINYERVPVLGISEIGNRPYSRLPSPLSAIVRVTAAQSPTAKPFLTDYYTD